MQFYCLKQHTYVKVKPNKFTDSYTLSVKVTYMYSVNHTLRAQDHCTMKQFPRQFKAVVGSLLAIIGCQFLVTPPLKSHVHV